MKKLLWMMLAALPMQAMANEEDPIAYKCYYCTPAEMEDVALAQGVGRHYVYDANNLNIVGFNVESAGSSLIATSFTAEDWVERQFKGMIGLYRPHDGSMQAFIHDVELLAPGSDHGRTNQLLWGHQLSLLHPEHGRARETIRRFLRSTPELAFLDTDSSEGKLLRFEYMLEGDRPIVALLLFSKSAHGNARFYLDHATREWRFLDTKEASNPIQHQAVDFAPKQGHTYFRYSWMNREQAKAFIERAQWANIPVHGQFDDSRDVSFGCERKDDDIQCYIY